MQESKEKVVKRRKLHGSKGPVDHLHFSLKRVKKTENPSHQYPWKFTVYTTILNLVRSYDIREKKTLMLELDIENGGIQVIGHDFIKVPVLEQYFRYLNDKYLNYSAYSISQEWDEERREENGHTNDDFSNELNEYTKEFRSAMKSVSRHFQEQHPKWNTIIEPADLSTSITSHPPTLYICDNYLTWQFYL